MAAPVSKLRVDLETKTASFQTGMADAAKTARGSFKDIEQGAMKMSESSRMSMTDAREGVMLLGEQFGVHLPRALTTFVAELGPVAGAIEAAFPFIAIAALAGILIEHLVALHEAGIKLTDGGSVPATRGQRSMSGEYGEAFLAFVRSGGKQASSALSEGFDALFGGFALPAFQATLNEGTPSQGGYVVPVVTDDQIVPLGMPDLGVRSLARVIATENDIKIPSQSSFSTAGIKLESGDTAHQFTESNPTLAQFTLSAYMAGLTHTVSWELLQDVSTFQTFAVSDLLNAIDILEDGFFVSGTGTNQPQGLLGNVGTGTGAAYAVESTGQYLLDAVMDALTSFHGAGVSLFPQQSHHAEVGRHADSGRTAPPG